MGDPQPHGLTGEEVDALRGRYIHRLTAVLIHHVPAFWKVALSVSTGKFAKVSKTLIQILQELGYLWISVGLFLDFFS